MSASDITLGSVPSDPAALPAEQGSPEPPAPEVPAEEEKENTRRRKLVLLILFLLLLATLILSIWYLLFRKPITEIPLPIVPEAMPSYQYAFYDFTKPQDVAVSADGSRIYITQTGASQDTLLIDGKGNTLGVLQPPAATTAQAHQLFLALDPLTGEIWATDRYNGRVFIYNADGTYDRAFDPGAAQGGWQPLGIGFDQQGNVYVADVSREPQVVHEFSPDGTLVRDLGSSAGLNHPNGIAVDSTGNVYVTDTGNGRLLVFDTAGNLAGTVGRGNAVGDLGLPVGVAIDDHGHVLVADSSASTIQAYAPYKAGDRGPAYINAFGEKGAADGNLSFPNGLTVDARGRVYVADWGNDRLQVWSY